ncbi:hypothetical protein BB561_007023, partial [Smittium simulii]
MRLLYILSAIAAVKGSERLIIKRDPGSLDSMNNSILQVQQMEVVKRQAPGGPEAEKKLASFFNALEKMGGDKSGKGDDKITLSKG